MPGWPWSKEASGGTIRQAFVRADAGNTEMNENWGFRRGASSAVSPPDSPV